MSDSNLIAIGQNGVTVFVVPPFSVRVANGATSSQVSITIDAGSVTETFYRPLADGETLDHDAVSGAITQAVNSGITNINLNTVLTGDHPNDDNSGFPDGTDGGNPQ